MRRSAYCVVMSIVLSACGMTGAKYRAAPTPAPMFYPVYPEPAFQRSASRQIAGSETGDYAAWIAAAASALGIEASKADDVLSLRSESVIVSDGASYRRLEMDALVLNSCGQEVFVWIPEGGGKPRVYSTEEACRLE